MLVEHYKGYSTDYLRFDLLFYIK